MSGDLVFDYVIVGAGSAGCVLASRLSEDLGISVALLEAGGPDDSVLIRAPTGGLGGAFVSPSLIRKLDRTDAGYRT